MTTALAVSGNRIAPTLGQTSEFLLLNGNGEELGSFRPAEKIPPFLKRHQVKILICGGIGCCMMDLLSAMKIKVIPGISGEISDVRKQFNSGNLHPGEKYTCAERGHTCGTCPGSF